MRQEELACGGPLGPFDRRRILPCEQVASSDRLGWVGLEAARYSAPPASEIHRSALTHHTLILFARPPEELDLAYEGVKRHVPPPAGAISPVPAGTPARARTRGCAGTRQPPQPARPCAPVPPPS